MEAGTSAAVVSFLRARFSEDKVKSGGNPRRIAELRAVELVVALHEDAHECPTIGDDGEVGPAWIGPDDACSTLALLARVYEQHTAYREAWRP